MTVASNNSWDGLITEPEFDQPETTPKVVYMICSIPRSGSSLFCDRLYHAGYGVPAEYWFPHQPTQRMIQRWGAETPAEYVRMLPTRRTVNGVFGFKTHWAQYKKTQWDWGRPDLHFKDIRYIRISRRDRERQAVSWWIAAATDYWNDVGRDPQPKRIPPVNFGQVEQIYRGIGVQEACWDNFLSHHDHLQVVFEEFIDDQPGTMQQVGDFLGRPSIDTTVVSSALIRRMSIPGAGDLLNAYREWRVSHA